MVIGAEHASGGLVVTSYRTLASTNGYAPTNQTQYFSEQRLENISSALAEVSGDWTGPNSNGTPNTWHFVGSSRASSTTTITPDSYTVEAAASFEYLIETTSAFVDPRSISIFGPGGTAQYRGFFETDIPLLYSITAQLNQRGRVRLSSFAGAEIFDVSNSAIAPQLLNLSGLVPPGQYQFLAAAGVGAANLPNGINHYERSGSFENLVFTVSVPEPRTLGIGAIFMIRRRGRSGDSFPQLAHCCELLEMRRSYLRGLSYFRTRMRWTSTRNNLPA